MVKKAVAFLLAGIMTAAFVPAAFADSEESLILRYSFDGEIQLGEGDAAYVADDSGKGNTGLVFGGVKVENGYAYFDGKDGSYIQLPDSIVAGEQEVSFVINVRPEMGPANQFTFTIGNSGNDGYLFLNTNRPDGVCRFAATANGWWSEKEGLPAPGVSEDTWASIVITMEGNIVRMYVDGQLITAEQPGEEEGESVVISESEVDIMPSSLGDTKQNYIAKSQYDDPYFAGYIDDFRIYSGVLSEEEIQAIAVEHKAASSEEDKYIAKIDLESAADTISFAETTISKDIELPTSAGNASVSWSSDKPEVLSESGVITRQPEDETVILTALISDGFGNETERKFEFTVVHKFTDEENVKSDIESLVLAGNLLHLKENLFLPAEGALGSVITWESGDESVITNEGVITQAPIGGGAKSTVLTATVTYGGYEEKLSFDITVDETDYAYLFAYFTGNNPNQEQLFYGLSLDGYNFNALNGGNAVLKENVGTGCIRDPFIFKGQDGLYYCLVTDMQSSLGWSSNYAMTVWSSEDLITWENETRFDFRELFADIPGYSEIDRVWAPQAIWDPEYVDEETGEKGAYMIYLALKIPSVSGQTQMYKVYTKDFKTLISEPERFYCHDVNASDIDADIIYRDGLYYMYVKDETSGGIYVVTSEHAGGPYGDRINALPTLNLNNGASVGVEGSGIYKKIGEDKYNIVYDAYNNGFFIMTETEDLISFNQLQRATYGFDFTPRHGYVVTISKEECDALMEAYGTVIPEKSEESEEPIVYYEFEEDGTDSSGNFYDAQLMENASVAQGGIVGNALYLDGSSTSYAMIPSEAVSSLYDYTISAWIKPESDAWTQRLFDFGTGTSRYMFFTPFNNSSSCRYAITINSYGNENGITAEKQIQTNMWTLVTVTSKDDVVSLYINGEKVGETEGVELDPYEISSNITQCYIGKSQFGADAFYTGYIDEFKVYNRALSEDEVRILYFENTPFAFITERDGDTVTVTVSSDGREVERASVVIAEYNDEGILIRAAHADADFAENSIVSVSLEVSSDNYRVFLLDSMGTLRPLR